MKIIRRRKPSIKTVLGITKAKRRLAKAIGIPTTKSGRKRKVLNTATGGAYGKYQRTRAKITRPYRYAKHPPSCMGCLVAIMTPILVLAVLLSMLL